MGQLEDYRLFVQVVESQSISKAATKLGIVKSAVSRRLSQLEDTLETVLIARTARQWSVTDSGQVLYERAIRIIAEIDDVNAVLRNQRSVERGPIQIAVPLHFGMDFLSPALLEFAQKYPQIHLTADFSDRMVNLAEEKYDISIRISQLQDSSLIAKKLGEVSHVLCASPAYLEQAPALTTLDDLKQHRLLQFGPAKRFKWTFLDARRREFHVALTSTLNSNNGQFLAEAAKDGQGIVRLPEFLVQQEIDAGRLVTVLDGFTQHVFGMYALYPETRHLPHQVRLLLDFMALNCIGK